MKLHDLKPADGSRTKRTRVGRGIAAGKGKTAGRGTKGQKSRTGGSIPPWFEGGQTPLHMRIPKLRGFKNRLKIEYEIVNVGRIGELALVGAFEPGDAPGAKKSAKAAPVTVNQEILRAVGLVRTLDKPMKVLGHGDIDIALFVVADAFSKSAVAKIEAAGGSIQALEIPTKPLPALRLEPAPEATPEPAAEAALEPVSVPDEEPAKAKPARSKSKATKAEASEPEADASVPDEEPVKAKPARAKAKTAKADVASNDKPARGSIDADAPVADAPAADAPVADADTPVADADADAPVADAPEADVKPSSDEAPAGEDT
jgi:large subunit ribosomal protein L15